MCEDRSIRRFKTQLMHDDRSLQKEIKEVRRSARLALKAAADGCDQRARRLRGSGAAGWGLPQIRAAARLELAAAAMLFALAAGLYLACICDLPASLLVALLGANRLALAVARLRLARRLGRAIAENENAGERLRRAARELDDSNDGSDNDK